MTHTVNALVHLRAAQVSLVLDVTEGQLPAILHWGADLGDLSSADVSSLALAAAAPVAPNAVDEPVRVSILPAHHTGWTGRPGLSGSRGGDAWSPRFRVSHLTLDGTPVDVTGKAPLLLTGGAGVVDVVADDPDAELALHVTVELTAAGLVRSRASVTNHGAHSYEVRDLVLAYPVPSLADELLDLTGRWGRERAPQRRPFTVGTHLREGRRGRTGADAATLMHAATPGVGFATGEVWAIHTAWSGNHTHYAERLASGERVLGGGELLLPGEVALAPGEEYTSPWLYGSWGEGLDEVARRFHRHLRARPGHPSADRPVTLNVWEAVYFDHSLEPLLELAETAASLGVERYVLDDGWFGSRRNDHSGLGDWTVSRDVWPDGLHPLVNRVVDLGMEFGLWFEPEMVNLDSDVARAHPEWIMAAGGRIPVPSRHQQVLNLSIPECYDYIRDAILALLQEYRISYIKWDHNRDLIDAGTRATGHPAVHAQTLAVYRLMDELRAAHPGLEIESCSSGGARVDLGVLERTDRIWVSDCIDPLERQQMLRWTTQLVPPELMGSHIASGTSHTTGRTHGLGFRAATAVFGHLGIEWDLRRASADERADLAAWIAFFKAERGLLLRGDLVRIDLAEEDLIASGVVAPDRSRAIYSFASVGTPVTALRGRLRMPGLDPDRRYRVQPILIGEAPSGLNPPAWWGISRDVSTETDDLVSGHGPRLVVGPTEPGVVLPGSVLARAGVMEAMIHPEQAILYRVEAVDDHPDVPTS